MHAKQGGPEASRASTIGLKGGTTGGHFCSYPDANKRPWRFLIRTATYRSGWESLGQLPGVNSMAPSQFVYPNTICSAVTLDLVSVPAESKQSPCSWLLPPRRPRRGKAGMGAFAGVS